MTFRCFWSSHILSSASAFRSSTGGWPSTSISSKSIECWNEDICLAQESTYPTYLVGVTCACNSCLEVSKLSSRKKIKSTYSERCSEENKCTLSEDSEVQIRLQLLKKYCRHTVSKSLNSLVTFTMKRAKLSFGCASESVRYYHSDHSVLGNSHWEYSLLYTVVNPVSWWELEQSFEHPTSIWRVASSLEHEKNWGRFHAPGVQICLENVRPSRGAKWRVTCNAQPLRWTAQKQPADRDLKPALAVRLVASDALQRPVHHATCHQIYIIYILYIRIYTNLL